MTTTPKSPSVYQQRILDSFIHHVAIDGYDGTNFSTIAADLGVAKGTIVHHFGTKEQLLATMHEQYMLGRTNELVQIIEALDTPAAQLTGILYSFALAYEYHRDETVAFQREVVRLSGSPALRQGVELRRAYFNRIVDVIDAGIAADEFHEHDSRLRMLLVFGSAQWMWTWYRMGREVPVDDVGRELATLALSGLLRDTSQIATLVAPDGLPATTARRTLGANTTA